MQAKLQNFLNAELQQKSERYESFRDGGGGMVLKPDVIIKDTQLSGHEEGELVLRALKDGAFIEATCRALEWPEDWAEYGVLKATMTNGPTPVKAEFSLLGARNRIVDRRWIQAHEQVELEFDLRDLPLIAGRRPPYQPTGVRIKVQWGATYKTDGELLVADGKWPATEDNSPVELKWNRVWLEALAKNVHRSVVDRFGQRLRGSWPTKIHDLEHFEKLKQDEERWLEAKGSLEGRGRYGGDLSSPQREGTAFFRVECVEGVWWYIDPEGYPFWSVGTTGIRVSDTTILEGCEHFFDELPDRDGPLALFYDPPIGSPANDGKGKEVVSFYLLNVLRKYGSLENWRDHMVRRYKTWGYNTFGNWSDEIMMEQQSIAHTRALTTRVGPSLIAKRMPDVFDPRWEEAFGKECSENVTPHRDNPWLLGYFVDNEMPWGGLNQGRFLECSKDAKLREEWLRWVRDFYAEDLQAFNHDFELSLPEWEGVKDLVTEDIRRSEATERALSGFVGHYAEVYFSKVNAILKSFDPNHLYLGCRFVRKRPHDLICEAAGRHCDVVTVNCYSMIPEPEQFRAWHESTGRPIQIGEHHLPLESERQCPPLYPAFTADERRVGYERFLRVFAEQPWSLGAHWFQHADQNATGRPVDGENQTVGFVDITDRPHPDLIEAAMAVTPQMYHWHKSAK